MIRNKVPRGLLIRDAILRETYRLRELAKSQGYMITPEPVSNLFVTGANVTIEQIVNQDDPLRAIVVSKVTGIWRPEAEKMISKLDGEGIPFKDLGRSGAPYMQLPVKKISKLNKYMHQAINESDYLWRQPWWKEIGVPVFQSMLRDYHQASLLNIDKIIADPDLAIGDKPEDTGTGWHAPINNRRTLSQHIERAAPYMRTTIDSYYKDMIEAITYWPENDIQIQLGIGYKGITGGVRSDVNVVEWTKDYQRLESTAREVGNDPSSAVHNKVLDDIAWRQGIWSRTTTKYHLDVSDINSYELVRSTPPATIGGDPDDLAVVGADFGYCNTLPKLTPTGIIPIDEDIAFGADNISLLGIMLNTAENTNIIMMKSGAPFTMMHYNVVVGQAVGYWADKLSLHLKILQVGDDLNIIMPLHEIPLLFEAMGHSLRIKGMIHRPEGDGIFILGKWNWWKGRKHLTSFITPRILKSLTSAKRKEAGTLPQNVRIGESYITENTDPEIEEQIKQLWKTYSSLIYFSGTPQEYLDQMQLLGSDGYKQLAASGIMDWMLEDGIVDTFGRETIAISNITRMPALDTNIAKEAVVETPIVMETRLSEPLPTEPTLAVSEEYIRHRIESAMKDTEDKFDPRFLANLMGIEESNIIRLMPRKLEVESLPTSSKTVTIDGNVMSPEIRSLSVREVLQNPADKSTRIAFNYGDVVVVIKFPDLGDTSKYTFKILSDPAVYEETKTYWNTKVPITDDTVVAAAKEAAMSVLSRIGD